MISKTGYLILGLLLEKPLTGYMIKKLTELRFRSFWSESYGQIYPQLKKLAEEGFVKAKEEAEGGRDRIAYALTKKGRTAFAGWLGERRCQDHLRMESILKIYMAASAKDPACAALLKDFGARSAAVLDELRMMRAQVEGAEDPFGNHRGIAAVLDLGIATYEAWARWAGTTELAREV